MAPKTKFDDALDYIFIANGQSPNTYVISPAHKTSMPSAAAPAATASLLASSNHEATSRIAGAVGGSVTLISATVTATTALLGQLPATSSASFPTEYVASDDASYSNVAVDLGSFLFNGSLFNDTSLLADIVNGSFSAGDNATSANATLNEDMGELIRMAATAIVLGLMILITIIGNVFVIAAIILERHLQNVANYLVASLAVADLFVACLVMPLGAVYEISQGWILGPELCDIWTSIDVLCCTASILHLVAIAVDRFWAVTNIDYIHSRTNKRVFLMIFFVWTAAVIVSLAPQFGWKDPDYLQRIEQQKCMVSQDIAYQIFATCSTFYVPLLVILFLYWKIYQTARKRIHRRRPRPTDVPGNNNQPELTAQKKRKRLRLRIGKFTNAKNNGAGGRATTLGLVEGNSTNTVNTVEVEDTEFSSSNVDSKSRAGVEVANANTSGQSQSHLTTATITAATATPATATANTQTGSSIVEETPSAPSTQIATVSHLVALAHQQHTSSKAQKQSKCLTQPVTVVDNPLEPKDASTTFAAEGNGTPPPTIEDAGVANSSAAASNNNQLHATEVLADPQLQHQLEQVQLTHSADTAGATNALVGAAPAPAAATIPKAGGGTSNATTITSISALSPQTPTGQTTSAQADSQGGHATAAFASASSEVTPIPRAKHPQQLSSIANPMHKVTKRKETLEAKRERKAAKTLAIITGAFVVCWLPFFAMALILPLCVTCQINDGIASLFLWLGYFNSTLNPVIYTIFSPEFRQAFKRILFGGHRPVHYRSGKL